MRRSWSIVSVEVFEPKPRLFHQLCIALLLGQIECLLEVLPGLVYTVQLKLRPAPVVVGVGIVWIQPKGLIVVGYRLVETANLGF